MSFIRKAETWDIDIDRYVNRIVPPSPLHRLPSSISRFLGYRKEQNQDVGNVLGAFWSCVGAFCGLAVIAAVFNNTGKADSKKGASAVLEYNAIRSPLGQPRNALLGHTFSAIIGVAITKLFQLHSDFEKIKWMAGAISCGIASATMLLTGTVHPPGGASAVLAATSPEITAMGWYFVGLVMWGTTLMLIVGLAINNIQRQFPVYWWTPLSLRQTKRVDVEVGSGPTGAFEEKTQALEDEGEKVQHITISALGVTLPENLALNGEEVELLERLRNRLRKVQASPSERSISSGSSASMTMVPSRGAGSDGDTYGGVVDARS
ncbi:DNA repair protein rad16 [Kalmusia sp. IMI 367209]|nr:DNA repair protein rad16 [Kalmusia sp. IMI 367209]